jgi:hypothetical protein
MPAETGPRHLKAQMVGRERLQWHSRRFVVSSPIWDNKPLDYATRLRILESGHEPNHAGVRDSLRLAIDRGAGCRRELNCNYVTHPFRR